MNNKLPSCLLLFQTLKHHRFLNVDSEKLVTVLLFAVENIEQNLTLLNIDSEKPLTVLLFAVENIEKP